MILGLGPLERSKLQSDGHAVSERDVCWPPSDSLTYVRNRILINLCEHDEKGMMV